MHVARPPNGFFIEEVPNVTALIASEAERWPRLPELWADVKERLRFVAHRSGTADRRLGPGHKLFVVQADPLAGTPKLRLVYHLLGDTVTIKMVAVLPGT
jgi:hypothetical protein